MPYKDREQKLAHMREWRKKKMKEGYGVWLYNRRKLRFDDADRFRKALQEILACIPMDLGSTSDDEIFREIANIADQALEESNAAEEALGHHSPSE